MSEKEAKKKLVGPRGSLLGIIWLVGIIILAVTDWWWPGILVLVVISIIYVTVQRRNSPQAFVEEQPDQPTMESQSEGSAVAPMAQVTPVSAPSTPEHRFELLPQACPNCNGPIRSHEVKWTGPQSANCPYCGTNLPMSSA
jgi:hypothetical protein